MAKSGELPNVGGALYDADILGNMYDAAARYRKAMYEARRNMSNLIKENADKQTSTPYPVLPKEKYYGNINPNMPPIQSKEKINKANEDAKKAQQDYNLLQEAEMKQSQPSFVGPPSPFTSAKPTLSERMQVTAPEAKTQITQADVLKDMLKTPQNPNLTRKASVLAYNTGVGGGDASTVNPEVSNYFSGQLQSYGNTKKGLSDFMTRLAQIEANEGNVLDFTAGLAEQDPASIRKEATGGAPTLTDMMKIPDDISKKAGELRGEASGLANEFDIRRATEHIGKLIGEYPTAHAALQNGTLTVAPDGSLQYDYGKIAQLSQDERNNIAEFLGKAGALGNKVYAMDPQHGGLGQKKDYRTVLSPELMKSQTPREQYDANKEVKRGEEWYTYSDEFGDVNAFKLNKPNVNNPSQVFISKDDPGRDITLYEWTNGDKKLYIDPATANYVYEYKDSQGKTRKDRIPQNELFNKIKTYNLKSQPRIINGKQDILDMSSLGVKDKKLFIDLFDFNHAARNNNANYFSRYSGGDKARGSIEGGGKTRVKEETTEQSDDGNITKKKTKNWFER